MHTETPTAPEGLTGTIQNISDDTGIAQTGAKAVSSINWSMPENNMDKTSIDYFEITLIGTRTNNTMTLSVRMSDQYSLQQTFSQKYLLTEGNYTSVSVTTVDLCGKRSKNIQVHLTNTTTASMTMRDSSLGTSDAQQQNVATIIGAVLGVLLLTFMVLAGALLVAVCILVRRHDHKDKLHDRQNNVGFSRKNEQGSEITGI